MNQSQPGFSLTDFGCGVGAYFDYLSARGHHVKYLGIDGTAAMVDTAREMHKDVDNCQFEEGWALTRETDYTVVSGTFNYKGETPFEQWQDFVLTALRNIDQFSTKGFAFNLLTSYSDKEKMLSHLYYPSPSFYFDYCKSNFSKNIALLHDYGAYEFTVLVRK